MNSAWQQRGYERQKLVKKLRDRLWNLSDEVEKPDGLYFDLAITIINFLKLSGGESPERDVSDPADLFFWKIVKPEIEKFARVPEETVAMIACFLEKILKTPLGHFQDDLLHAEISRPQEVFLTPSAMTDVPLKEEA